MMKKQNAKLVACATAIAAGTWIACTLLCYLLAYDAIGIVYQKYVVDLAQTSCGQMAENELIYKLRPGKCKFSNIEFDTVIEVDDDGFRNPPRASEHNHSRIAFLGDSHAMGWGVDQSAIASSIIARKENTKVHNLAVSSYGTVREMFALKSYGRDSDLIILQYCPNDLAENLEFLKDPATFVANAPRKAREYEAYRSEAERTGGGRRFRLTRAIVRPLLWSLMTTWRFLGLPPRIPVDEMSAADVAVEAKAFAAVIKHFEQTIHDRPLIIYEAADAQIRHRFAPAFRAALDAQGIRNAVVVDLSATTTPRDFFHIDDHQSASGHAKIAERLLVELGRYR